MPTSPSRIFGYDQTFSLALNLSGSGGVGDGPGDYFDVSADCESGTWDVDLTVSCTDLGGTYGGDFGWYDKNIASYGFEKVISASWVDPNVITYPGGPYYDSLSIVVPACWTCGVVFRIRMNTPNPFSTDYNFTITAEGTRRAGCS